MGDDFSLTKFLYDFVIVGLASGTVSGFLVDRFIRYREERRWEPARNLLYVAILNILKDFTWIITSISVDRKLVWDKTTKVYLFGGSELFQPFQELVDPAQLTNTNAALVAALRSQWLAGAEFDRANNAATAKPAPPPPQLDALKRAKEAMERVFQTYGILFDAELRTTVGRFSAHLDAVINYANGDFDWLDNSKNTLYIDQLIDLLRMAFAIRTSLIKFGMSYESLQVYVSSLK